MKHKNPAKGGRYVRATPDSEAVLVKGTDQTPAAKPASLAKPATKTGGAE